MLLEHVPYWQRAAHLSSARTPRRSRGCDHAQAFLVAALALAGQAATDISSVTGILDTVSSILAMDVDPAGIAADTAVRAAFPPSAQAGTASDEGYKEASGHQDAVHSPLLPTTRLPGACMLGSTYMPAFAYGQKPTQTIKLEVAPLQQQQTGDCGRAGGASGAQCLAPWLRGMVDPSLVQTELGALSSELTAVAVPAFHAFTADVTTLLVRREAAPHAAPGMQRAWGRRWGGGGRCQRHKQHHAPCSRAAPVLLQC